MNTTRYNGWTNYETWAVKLWMDNEESTYNEGCRLAADTYEQAAADRIFTRQERAIMDLSERLKAQYEDARDDLLESAGQGASVWADLLGAALAEINWHEIAKYMIAREVEDATT